MTKQEKEQLEPIFDVLITLLDGMCMDDTERSFELFWPERFLHLTGDEDEDFELQKDRFHQVDYFINDVKKEMKKIMR